MIPLRYQLTALTDGSDRPCTLQNIEDSDGTLIVNRGDLDDSSRKIQAFAQQRSKPYLVVQLDADVTDDLVTGVLAWLRKCGVATLNVAGPSERERPGIYDQTYGLLAAIDRTARSTSDSAEVEGPRNPSQC